MHEIRESNIGEPMPRRALSIRYRPQAHLPTRNQNGEHRMLASKYS
jgi:hypothetical protein